jgi:NADPH-dependent 2,4-dienoyl-CoA reductase/sulfur reductase-like enzyme/rhodanese-related sulfurtransferase
MKTILQTLLDGYVGPLTDRQRELLSKADVRCDQALESIRRLLTIARGVDEEQGSGQIADVAAACRRMLRRYAPDALDRDVSLASKVPSEPVYVRGHDAAFCEVVAALVENALKYTPSFGHVRVALAAEPGADKVRIRVSDSGVGVPETDRQRIFEPFFRTPTAQSLTVPGAGLGLAFVKAIVEAAGGTVGAGKSDLGGAEITVDLPVAEPAPAAAMEGEKMSGSMKVVIVGGVAAGPKVASKVIRLMSDAEVTVVEKGKLLSYAGCGLPYYVSGVVPEQKQLMSSAVGVVRDTVFFQQVKNVQAMNQTEAVEIDRPNRRLRVVDLANKRESWLDYDKLVLATGASPVVPKIPNVDLGNVFTLHGVHDAEGMKVALAQRRARDVVIVGGGLIGVEITEALAEIGSRVTIVEMAPQILGILDWEMAKLVEQHMESQGVKILVDTKVERFEGQDKVESVVTTRASLAADIVILGSGVRPNTALAKAAGLELGPTGAIRVDERMRTSDPDIYAAGDCVECMGLVSGKPCYVPLGSTANKQGRVAAVNICGGDAVFPGVLGTTVCKVFDYCVARTGLTEVEARRLGHDVVTALVPAPDKEHFMPTAAMLLLKVVVDAKTRRLLGVQATGPGAGDKRIDVAAMAIAGRMTVDDLANADLCYAPPYSAAMDNLITAANVAGNKLDGHMDGITPMEVHEMLRRRDRFVFVDVRSPVEHEKVRLPGGKLMPLGTLRGRLDELPRDRTIVTFCNTSLRGYEAALILKAAGFPKVRVMDGGIEMWPYEKIS